MPTLARPPTTATPPSKLQLQAAGGSPASPRQPTRRSLHSHDSPAQHIHITLVAPLHRQARQFPSQVLLAAAGAGPLTGRQGPASSPLRRGARRLVAPRWRPPSPAHIHHLALAVEPRSRPRRTACTCCHRRHHLAPRAAFPCHVSIVSAQAGPDVVPDRPANELCGRGHPRPALRDAPAATPVYSACTRQATTFAALLLRAVHARHRRSRVSRHRRGRPRSHIVTRRDAGSSAVASAQRNDLRTLRRELAIGHCATPPPAPTPGRTPRPESSAPRVPTAPRRDPRSPTTAISSTPSALHRGLAARGVTFSSTSDSVIAALIATPCPSR